MAAADTSAKKIAYSLFFTFLTMNVVKLNTNYAR